jgi:hypothetical protein
MVVDVCPLLSCVSPKRFCLLGVKYSVTASTVGGGGVNSEITFFVFKRRLPKCAAGRKREGCQADVCELCFLIYRRHD